MSVESLQAIHDAVQTHYREMNGDSAVLTDWFVAYGGMASSDESDSGIAHPSGYATSDSSPFSALGVAHMGLENLSSDLTYGDDDD